MVERKEYLDQLWAWKDEQQIKVVTGIRRCGKSVLLEQYQQKLLAEGVAPEQIISINFENLDYEPLKDYMELYRYLKERLCTDKMTYIFLDEVQEVPSFEKVVDSLSIKDQVDIYITGSNASELATLLSGRYTEIKMLPFSFREYIAETGLPKEEAFAEFMKTGGIPYVAAMNRTDEKVDQYLEGIYNTVIVKDIEQRQLRKEKEGNTRKITVKEYCTIFSERNWQPRIHEKHNQLPDLVRKKNFTKHRQRLCRRFKRIVYILFRRAL